MKVAGAIRAMMNAINLQLEYATILYWMFWREKRMSGMKGVQMDKLKGLLSIRKIVPNA